jgi:nucleoside-diphosphate-sugar epimerase
MISGYHRDIPKAAFILGGTGQIGRAAARRLLEAGWDVTVGARTSAETDARLVQVDRSEEGALAAALGDGVDVLVDVIPYTAADAQQLVSLRDRVGSVIAISSASVYADTEGRGFDTQETDVPQYPTPVTERQSTVPPGDASYAARKVAIEQALLDSGLRATILRPGAIHGPGSPSPRELYFVKRFVDGRKAVLLAHRGANRFHTTSVANLAELVWLAAERPGRRVLNAGDPDPPTTLEIARAHADVLGAEWAEVLLPGEPEKELGSTPWSAPWSLVLSMSEAELELRYRPVTTYERALRETVAWLLEARPEPTGYLADLFDYDAEDAYLDSLRARG